MISRFLLVALAVTIFCPSLAQAEGPVITANAFFKDQTLVGSFISADVDKDGLKEVIVGAARGQKPFVRIYNADGSVVREFLAYAETFMGGVNVAACDLVPGGSLEFVTGAGYTGSPHVRTFDSLGNPLSTEFDAYAANFKGGVNVACGDVDADGVADIVTGAGITGGPHVKVFSNTGTKKLEMFAAAAGDPVGAYVAVGDVNGVKGDEIVTSPVAAGIHGITTLTYRQGGLRFLSSFPVTTTPIPSSLISLAEVSADPGLEIVVTRKSGADSIITAYSESGVSVTTQKISKLSASIVVPLAYASGLATFAAADTYNDIDGMALAKYIQIDLSEQRLRAYEYGVEVQTFLVSTGKPGYATPIGKTAVMAKIPVMTYAWSYGPNNPNNYNLPGVKWNLRFRKHHYIHSAYWHKNFGRVMSHGCVNTSIPDAEKIYAWADVGTVVEVVK